MMRVCVLVGSPGLEATIEIWDVPSGVLEDATTLSVKEIGFPLVGNADGDGWNWQLAPEGKPVQESVTVPVNELSTETSSATGAARTSRHHANTRWRRSAQTEIHNM